MPGEETARSALRSGTAHHHERVDRLFSGIDFGDRADYARFLTAQAVAHVPTEEALTLAGAAAILPDWTARRRADLLREDLAALGVAMPAVDAGIAFGDPASVLGGIYVLEGSRLGGRLIGRLVPPHLPARFLAGTDSAAWQRLLAVLEQRLVTREQRATAIDSAIRVVDLFEAGATRSLRG